MNNDEPDVAKAVLFVLGAIVWCVFMFFMIGFFATIGPFAAF